MLVSSPVNAEIMQSLGDGDASRLSFSAVGSVFYESRPAFTALNGDTNEGFERFRLTSSFRLQYSYANIGDPVWSEIKATGTVNGIDPIGDGLATLDIDFIHKPAESFGGLSAAIGSGGYYGFVSNGAVSMRGQGSGHTGGHSSSAAQTGLFDTFQRLHGNTSSLDDDMLVAGDPTGTLNFISEDLGGSNEEVFFGFGYVTDRQHFGLQTSANGEWTAFSFGQQLSSTLGMNAMLYAVDSTNINGRNVEDWGYDLIIANVTDRLEYGVRFTGWGYGSSPTWNTQNRTRIRLSSSYAITDRHAVGFNFDYEDFLIINPTTGAPNFEATVQRLNLMYGYHVNDYSFLAIQGVFTDFKAESGIFAGNEQSISEIKLSYNFLF